MRTHRTKPSSADANHAFIRLVINNIIKTTYDLNNKIVICFSYRLLPMCLQSNVMRLSSLTQQQQKNRPRSNHSRPQVAHKLTRIKLNEPHVCSVLLHHLFVPLVDRQRRRRWGDWPRLCVAAGSATSNNNNNNANTTLLFSLRCRRNRTSTESESRGDVRCRVRCKARTMYNTTDECISIDATASLSSGARRTSQRPRCCRTCRSGGALHRRSEFHAPFEFPCNFWPPLPVCQDSCPDLRACAFFVALVVDVVDDETRKNATYATWERVFCTLSWCRQQTHVD